ncbi:MAG: hypothetical protein WD942_01110 [Dehalococcoidia bacterium]
MTNTFEILQIMGKEDPVTSLLSRAINESPAFQDMFLDHIGVHLKEVLDVCARPSVKGGTPDLAIAGRSAAGDVLILVENKLRAGEGGTQTERYAARAVHDQLKKRLELQASARTELVLLTLFEEKPRSAEFKHRTYEDLAVRWKRRAAGQASPVTRLLDDWFELVDEFYESAAWGPNDELIAKLGQNSALDSGFLCFRGWTKGIVWGARLKPQNFFRSSQRGRRTYGMRVTKPAWEPGRMEIVTGGTTPMEPRRDISIHFEPQFDVLNRVLKFDLHYEPNPYKTVKWMKKHVRTEVYEAYQRQRTTFQSELKKALPEGWKLSGRSNQVANFPLRMEGLSAGDAAKAVASAVRPMEAVVDQLLQELKII